MSMNWKSFESCDRKSLDCFKYSIGRNINIKTASGEIQRKQGVCYWEPEERQFMSYSGRYLT